MTLRIIKPGDLPPPPPREEGHKRPNAESVDKAIAELLSTIEQGGVDCLGWFTVDHEQPERCRVRYAPPERSWSWNVMGTVTRLWRHVCEQLEGQEFETEEEG